MKITEIVQQYVDEKKKFDEAQKHFESIKSKTTKVMFNYFDKKNINSINIDYFGKTVTLSKVQSSKVVFDLKALKEALGDELFGKVTTKKYEVVNSKGLFKYLKQLGANPKIIKSFLNVEITVDEKALNNLSDVGEIDEDMLKGTYTIENRSPYIKIK